MGRYQYKRLIANNLSHGFWNAELDLLKIHGVGKTCCLVAENPEVEPLFKEWFPDTEFTFLGYSGKSGAEYEHDFNKPLDMVSQYYRWSEGKTPIGIYSFDSVLSQALLEHVCNPFQAVQNMVNLVKPGGTIVIHTVRPGFRQHRFPVDCVRFMPDFWKELCKYMPIKLLAYQEHIYHVFVCYRKL
jgi:SAM-dependent methyltransferase